jgi:catechol 2,3-dioxygenase
MLIQRIAHAAIRVHDLDRALAFYGSVLGLVHVARGEDGRVFLAGGRTSGYELALIPGGRGLEHFAFQVGSAGDLDAASERLRAAGTEVAESPVEHGITAGIRFELPSGHLMELVVPAEPVPFTTPLSIDLPHFAGVGPLHVDHVTLLADSVEPVVAFLGEHLGFRLSESVQPQPGVWLNAFLRARDQHHDLSFFENDGRGAQLDHVAFRVNSFEDIRRACDLVATLGYRIDSSPGRHVQGNNLFVYFRDPSGNRVELSGDMAAIDSAAQPRILRESTFDAWRPGLPPEMLSGT